MGVVYLATDLTANRPVAIKFLSGGPMVASRDRRRWLREARAAALVRHPHVVQLLHADEIGGWLYLVLEYVPGGSLADRVTGPLPPRTVATLLIPIAEALGELHSAGVWHLDLKPANILVDAPPGTPLDRAILKLSDFGIARSRDETNTTGPSRGAAQGTPRYMAPEQVAGQRSALGAATDIHAMGVILYELLTGRPPFLAESDVETMYRVRTDDPVPPRRLNPRIPRDLEIICLKCLAKAPERRYASARALGDDLRAWIAGRPIAARPVSWFEKSWRWCLRHRPVAALAAGLTLALFVGFLSALLLWKHAESERVRAEIERARAEADFEVGRGALVEILDLGEVSLASPFKLDRDRVVRSLRASLGRIKEMLQRRPDDAKIWYLVAQADLFLGRNLEYQNQLAEGESLYLEAMVYWDRLVARTPSEWRPRYDRVRTLECLGRILRQQGKIEQSEAYWAQAVNAGEIVQPLLPQPDFNTLAECRTVLAGIVGRRGDHERAHDLLEANIRMLSHLPDRDKSDSTAKKLSESWDVVLHASDVGELERWAQRVVRLADASPSFGDGDPRGDQSPATWIARALFERAAGHRMANQPADARRTADRLYAFARQLVLAHPADPSAHLVMKEAFRQFAKNAWLANDRREIERNWNLALKEAQEALRLGPHNETARAEVSDLERRLRDFQASRP
jgi:tetratricopeptide (TPR) repeat protein